MKLKYILILAVGATCVSPVSGLAEEPFICCETSTSYQNNIGALGTGDNSADIVTDEQGNVLGVKKGEITLHKVESGVEVYSGLNKVEMIESSSDGWVGTIEEQGSMILFKPAGRPELKCPAQAISNWFGPCKMQTEA